MICLIFGVFNLNYVLNVQFITAIIFILIAFYLRYLVKQNRAKIIVGGEVRLEIKYYHFYIFMIGGLTLIGISLIRNLFPDLPSWGTIPNNINHSDFNCNYTKK